MSGAPTSPWSDRATLRDRQYRTDAHLAARQSIYSFQQPRHDLPALVFDALALAGTETVVDVGCGNGLYLAALHRRGHRGDVIGVDLSPGMLAAARHRESRARLVAADATALPVADGKADVALAMHMLYHVPDPRQVIRELRRVTKPGGRVAVVLNGEDHLRELRDLVTRASVAARVPLPPRPPRLTMDVGERLMVEQFDSVDRLDVVAELVIPHAAPVTGYVRSMIGLQEVDGVEAVMAEVERMLAVEHGGDHPIRVRTRGGVLICR